MQTSMLWFVIGLLATVLILLILLTGENGLIGAAGPVIDSNLG